MMKTNFFLRIFLAAALFVALVPAYGQTITTTAEIKTTTVKNQGRSGTCWSFAAVSFLESELLRAGKGEHDLSEMYFVRLAYLIKAEKYVRLQGVANFGPGGQAHDVTNIWKDFYVLPEEVFPGLQGGDTIHNHNELNAYLHAVLKTAAKSEKAGSYKQWKKAAESLLDAFLGKPPLQFVYKGQNYTPESFSGMLGLNPGDYVEITSFSHHPWYSRFVLEVQDNWSGDLYYNIPLTDMISIMEHAISKGYTIAWDGDVSDDKSFSKNGGIATTDNEEQAVTQEIRQNAFDDFSTTDDHLMHITGIGTDTLGRKYYLTKNSWGPGRGNNGFWWLSENYVRLKTVAIMVHKDAIPADIAKKMKISR